LCTRDKKCAAFGKRREAARGDSRHDAAMDKPLLRALHTRRPAIRRQWENLLRLEEPANALAHPDTLVRLIDWTLDEAFAALGHPSRRAARRRAAWSHPPSYEHVRRACACGQNPLIEYFLAGERALLEALVLAQAETPAARADSRHTTATEVHLAVRRIARREVTLFCSVCRQKETLPADAGAREPACAPR
jgi:hypothetical protein